MNPNDIFRVQIGVKQKDLADYLGVSLPLLALYETGRRSLPHAAHIKLLQMHLVLLEEEKQVATASPIPFSAPQQEKTATMLARHIQNCSYKVRAAQRKLEALQKTCMQSQQMLLLIDGLLEKAPVAEMDQLWLNIMRRKADQNIDRSGMLAQTKLQLRISSLQQQMDTANQMLAQMGVQQQPE